ncbi:hypothetical protein [Microcoleus sp.]|uniref:hypothetical protein n=1 Tax=Microcoleus sp. TaxID=44472 RepID=UPI0035936A03
MSIDNPSSWQVVYSGQHFRSALDESIGRILIPGTFTQHIIRIYCTSSVAKSRWWLGGVLTQVLGSFQPDFEASRWQVPLNRTTLIQFPDLTAEYRLKFEAARWHKEIEIIVEEYISGT